MKGLTFTRGFLILLALAAIVPVIMAVQLYMVSSKYGAAREEAIQQWASNNPDGAAIVQRYRDACESGPTGKDVREAVKKEPLQKAQTFEACAAQVGSPSLISAISEAYKTVDATINVPAPLRWVVL